MRSGTTPLTDQQIEWLLAKIPKECVEEGDCLVWTMCLRHAAPQVNTPRPMGRVGVSCRLFLMEHSFGMPRPDSYRSYAPIATCGNPSCLKREHQEWVTKSRSQKMTAERTGYHLNPARNAKISNAAKHRKLTDEQAADVRLSTTPIRLLAEQYGVTFEAIRLIQQGITYKQYGSPWAGLMPQGARHG